MYAYRNYPNMSFIISGMIDRELENAELLGIDLTEPEMMGAWLKNLVGKVKKVVQKTKSGKGYSFTTPEGTVSLDSSGVQVLKPSSDSLPVASTYQAGTSNKMGIALAVSAAAIVAFLALRK